MRHPIRLAFAGLMMLFCVFPQVHATDTTETVSDDLFSVRRFLLAVGTNDGGNERVALRYAGTDAKSITKVFEELGGIAPSDRLLLLDPDRTTLRNTLQVFGQMINNATTQSGRVEVVIYYSGHSNEQGLLLGGELIGYKELRESVDAMAADVRIIILDSCASGALTRLKGGKRIAPFLLDTSTKMSGHAFLTSSSADEAAQESDRIGGSFFTHALVSGLRGAADNSHDNRVTLNEAYEYAFHSTLARTEKTSSGPQHPGYDIQLVGAGDLVITDLRGMSAGMVLDEELVGRLHVRDLSGRLVVEVEKPYGRLIELGLEPGDYKLTLDLDGNFYGARLTLPDGERTYLQLANLTPIATEFNVTRGDVLPAVRQIIPQENHEVIHKEFSFSVMPGMGTNGKDDQYTVSEFSMNLTIGRNRGLNGFEIGYLGNWCLGDVEGFQMATGMNLVEQDLEGAQLAGFANRVWGRAEGCQIAAFVNSIGGESEAVQLAGFGNIIEGKGGYAQFAGFANVALDTFEGAQISGFTNVALGDIEGAQIAGVVNLCPGDIHGWQVSGVTNIAGDLKGVQLSLVNVANHTIGHQWGLVNVSRTVRGSQVGLVNVADEVEGAPVGLLSFVRNGRHNLALWGTDTSPWNAGIKLGNEYVYSIMAVGGGDDSERIFTGLGIGLNVPKGRFFSELALISYYIHEDDPHDGADESSCGCDDDLHLLNKGRLGFGWQFTDKLAFSAGAVANVYVSKRNDGAHFAEDTWHSEKSGDTWIKAWPGFYAGFTLF
jgi:Caspase domain